MTALDISVTKPASRSSRTLSHWDVEDPAFWSATGRRIAKRNLWISIPSLLLAFSVWMLFSVGAVFLPQIGFKFTESQLFWLVALPGLSGATLRIFYSFLVPIFGGRNWTVVSTASLLIPCLGFGLAVQNPATPYWVFVTLSLSCGFGSGNFASSMANISFFFPKAQKGTALGLNAGLGNLGVSVVQFLVPLVVTIAFVGSSQVSTKGSVSNAVWLQNAGFVFIPFIVVCTVAAYFGMNNLATANASFTDQAVIFRRKHNWLMCWLYMGTFGSFIGYSAAFPLLIKLRFPLFNAMEYAFIGPLVGALVRPIGGWLSDKLGGARVTLVTFVIMSLAAGAVITFLRLNGDHFNGFLGSFLLLFCMTGIGNGSTFRMIPVIFLNQHPKTDDGRKAAGKESAATLGFSSALAAYGAFVIPKTFGWSRAAAGSVVPALVGLIAIYVSCAVVTWWFYARRKAECPC